MSFLAPEAIAGQVPSTVTTLPSTWTAAYAGAATGTARGPISGSHHNHWRSRGEWYWSAHGSAHVGSVRQSGGRGRDGWMALGMAMVSARRPVGSGWLELRGMGTWEPVMGADGYPLLLQTGETADGIATLVDRQHPHDAFMELSVSYRQEIDRDAWAFVYVAPIGEPALGPIPFMHRATADTDPTTPIGHHFMDASHIAEGVVTAGIHVDQRVQVEISVFNAHEPDQERWLPGSPSLNSFAGRVTLTPGRTWALQASFADLKEPEQLHPGIDVFRFSLSATHSVPLRPGRWSTTLAWGRNIWQEATMTLGEARTRLPGPLLAHYVDLAALPPGADDSWLLLFDRRIGSTWLLESALQGAAASLTIRVEGVRKDELFAAPDLRHSDFFRVGKVGVGVATELASVGGFDVGVGVSGSVHFVPTELVAAYGSTPTGMTAYTRIRF